jgi:hypothetical protein
MTNYKLLYIAELIRNDKGFEHEDLFCLHINQLSRCQGSFSDWLSQIADLVEQGSTYGEKGIGKLDWSIQILK